MWAFGMGFAQYATNRCHHMESRPMSRSSLCAAILAGAVVLLMVGMSLKQRDPVAMAQQASFTCTEVIGFSQTDQWYEAGFISSVPDAGAWQIRWTDGASIDR